MKLTKKKAKALSIKKWEWIVKNNGNDVGLSEAIPELGYLTFQCGFCEKYWDNGCNKCPLNINGVTCINKDSLYYKWLYKLTLMKMFKIDSYSINKKNAQAVLDLIKES